MARVFAPCVGRDLSALVEVDGVLPTRLLTHKADVDRVRAPPAPRRALRALTRSPPPGQVNLEHLQRLDAREERYNAIDSGQEHYVRMLDAACPARRQLRIKSGWPAAGRCKSRQPVLTRRWQLVRR